jgi:hypothetical protein
MTIKRKIKPAAIVAGAVICLIAARLAISVTGRDRTKYEVDAWVTTPEYKTDAALAIDAYERLMQRYMDLTEEHLMKLGSDCNGVTQRLDSICATLSEISERLARIERVLSIDPNEQQKTEDREQRTGVKRQK